MIARVQSIDYICTIRNFREEEVDQLFSLLNTLNQVQIRSEGQDRRIWALLADGTFSVDSLFEALSGGSHATRPLLKIWKPKAPFRVTAFAWLALHGAILTIDMGLFSL